MLDTSPEKSLSPARLSTIARSLPVWSKALTLWGGELALRKNGTPSGNVREEVSARAFEILYRNYESLHRVECYPLPK